MASGKRGDTIDVLMQRIDSLPSCSNEGTADIKRHLPNIIGGIEKAERTSESQNDDFKTWLAKAKDLVNDLIELTEDQNAPSRRESSRGWWTKLAGPADSLTPKIKEVTQKLKSLAEEYDSKFAQQTGGGIQNENDPTLTMLSLFHQKRCFSYCSLFPKDYEFDVLRLINLWTAEGFLSFQDPDPARSSDQPEDRGHEFVRSFIGSNIFQVVEKDEIDRVRTCKLKPEKHSLATSFSRYENMSVDPDVEGIPEGLRRVSFFYGLDISAGIPDSLFLNAKKLRTILLPSVTQSRLPNELKITTYTCEAIFYHFKSLRVLDLHNLGIKVLPASIGDLKYLKYLDLSDNNMEKLPSSITKLSNLQTLKLSRCLELRKLPKDLGDLKKLRHLEIEGCLDLNQMPSTIKHLTSLQTLSHFVVSKSYIRGLEELTSLKNLRGDLEILHLEQLNLNPSGDSLLKAKELEGLTLRWYHYNDVKNKASQSNDDDKYLKRLQPPEKLKVLSIVGYQGKKPQSLCSSLANLVKLSLSNCPRCEGLPELPKLKVLRLQRLKSLKFIYSHESTSSKTLMESLEELTILDCPNLSRPLEVENMEAKFQKISKLEVRYCPKLTCMPVNPDFIETLVLVSSGGKPLESTIGKINEKQTKQGRTITEQTPLSKLKYLQITEADNESPDVWIKNCTSLQDLHIQECPLLKSLPNNSKYLERLTIENCEQLELSNDAWSGLESLNRLILRGIPEMKSFPSKLEGLKCLEKLEIHNCRELKSLPATIRELTSLRTLVLSECNKLASLPTEIRNLKSLETLIIRDCLSLLPRCQRETGDDWPLIRKIKKLTLTQTSQGL